VIKFHDDRNVILKSFQLVVPFSPFFRPFRQLIAIWLSQYRSFFQW